MSTPVQIADTLRVFRRLLRDKRIGVSFISWSDVKEELDLKPIAAPEGPTEDDEADLAGLFSAFD